MSHKTDWPAYYLRLWIKNAVGSKSLEELHRWQAMIDTAKIIQGAVASEQKSSDRTP